LIDELATGAAARAIELRRAMHRHPELAWSEHETQAAIEARLVELGLSPVKVAGTGLYADVGEGERPVVYRADMDALPITDMKDPATVPCVSEVSGVSHACGHDVHCAVAVGLAEVLVRLGGELPGRVRLVFQPAEEVLPSGGAAVVADGVADGARACLALHADPVRVAGHVGVRAGPMTAAGDLFRIDVVGRGGHSSRPYLARDPVLAAARVVEALWSLAPQRVDPLEPAVITVGSIQGGSAPNVIAGRVVLTGTVRTFDETTRRSLQAAVREVSAAAAATQGCTTEIEIQDGAPSLVNDEALHELVRAAATDALGEAAVEPIARPSTGGEDFSHFAAKAPTYMLRLGVGKRNTEPAHLHTAFLDVDEGAVEVGIRVMARAVLAALG